MVRLDKPIDSLASQFILVRLTKIPDIDLRRFEFDCDLTWHVFFLNSEETIYGRYGGRDAASAESRLSLKGLAYAMAKALHAHATPPKPTKFEGEPLTPAKLAAGKNHRGCIHCHNVKEFVRANEKKAGTFDRESLWVYPLPENLGLTLEVDAGNRVKTVAPGSAADKAGLKPKHEITRIHGVSVASFADACYALHKAPKSGAIPLTIVAEGQSRDVKLEIAEGWRKTNLTWRPSLLDILPSLAFSGEDITAAEKKALGLSENQATLRQTAPVHRSLSEAGIQAGDIVVGIEGKSVSGQAGDLLGHIRRNYLVGDTLSIDLLRESQRIKVKLILK